MADVNAQDPVVAAPVVEESSGKVESTGASATEQNGAEPVNETVKEAAKEDTNGENTEEKPAEDATASKDSKDEAQAINDSGSPSSARKRKHSPDDWRARRDADNAADEKRGGRGGRGRGGGYRPRRGRGGSDDHEKRDPDKPREDYSKNVKSKYDDVPESDDPDEIRKQVEFYFGDSNLPQDKFLLTSTGGSENKAVAVKVLHNFKRMRHFQPYSAVVAALRDSDFLNIHGSDGNETITRKVPLKEDFKAEDPYANLEIMEDATRPRSIYAKGFGEEGPTTQTDIENFFAPYGPINSIRLRRSYPEKVFKGSVFVEFDSEETAKQFLELESKPKWLREDGGKTELKVSSKEEYVISKAKDVRDGTIEGNSYRPRGYGRGRGRGSDRGRGRGGGHRGDRRGSGRGGRDRDRNEERGDWRDRRSRDNKRENNNDGDEAKQTEAGSESKDAEVESKKRARDTEASAPAAADGEKDAKKAKVDE